MINARSSGVCELRVNPDAGFPNRASPYFYCQRVLISRFESLATQQG